jgi:hypothetical protein
MKQRTRTRLLTACIIALAVWAVFSLPFGMPLILSPFGLAVQFTTVLFAILPVAGLSWFVWHLFFSRRFRLQRLRRLRVAKGRTTNLLAPPPLFGAAYKKADHAPDRDQWQ